MRKIYTICFILLICLGVTACGLNEGGYIIEQKTEEETNQDEYTLMSVITVDDKKTLTLKLHGKKLSQEYDKYGINKIEVFDGKQILQTILMKDAIISEWGEDEFDGYSESYEKDGGITTRDMNFDNAGDIGIDAWITNGANNPRYYWIWNKEKKCFEYLFCMCNAEIDEENKQIISKTRESASEYYINYYEYDKTGTLVNVKRIIEKYDVNGDMVTEVYKIENGILEKVG